MAVFQQNFILKNQVLDNIWPIGWSLPTHAWQFKLVISE